MVRIEKTLTIEHLMPKEWESHWPRPALDGSPDLKKSAELRGELIHRIGNLTLLTKKLNPSVSNGPWERKLDAILKHSALNLNRTLPRVWDDDAIRARSEELLRIAITIWPRPAEMARA